MKVNNSIFTDGSSRGNPGPGGWGSIVALGSGVVELGGREMHTTNNRMELTAVIKALTYVLNEFPRRHLGTKQAEDSPPKFVIHLDSSYVMNGAIKWIFGWQKNNCVYTSYIHIDVKANGRVWLQHDGTDWIIADRLVERGISSKDIVIGFQPPQARSLMTEFALM